MAEGDRQFVDALARGLAILECLSRAHHPIGNRAISEAVGLAPSTVSRLTHTLCVLGYIRPAGSGRAYELTPKNLTLGYPVLAGLSLRDRARPHLDSIARETGETVALAIRDGHYITFVAVEQGTNLVSVRLATGGRLRMQVSAAGIALLSAMPEKERRMIAGRLRADLTRRGEPTEPFNAALDACMAEGVAVVRNSWREGVGGIAAPITFQGEIAALTIPVATGSVSEAEMRGHLADLLRREARAF
ncbi:IclR family transcriptional regulator [Roseovarius spongiae]|uniref:IclR family transcriptional regulator n=1 Tax=Roseovarius spongiae TaxID=2320272 RepID=A0A3A8B5B9_9RHOB|nr:IclR family transcriptional regulator [Roseovarius spongiae]RKF17271.1 IclR family transcriptional regulator [Roseovarius spongiae]